MSRQAKTPDSHESPRLGLLQLPGQVEHCWESRSSLPTRLDRNTALCTRLVGNPVHLSQLGLKDTSRFLDPSWESRSSLPTRLAPVLPDTVMLLGIPFISPN